MLLKVLNMIIINKKSYCTYILQKGLHSFCFFKILNLLSVEKNEKKKKVILQKHKLYLLVSTKDKLSISKFKIHLNLVNGLKIC